MNKKDRVTLRALGYAAYIAKDQREFEEVVKWFNDEKEERIMNFDPRLLKTAAGTLDAIKDLWGGKSLTDTIPKKRWRRNITCFQS